MINYQIVLMEIKRSFKSLIAWTLSVGFTLILVVILYPMVKDMYQNIPAELQPLMEMFGGVPEDVLGYFAVEAGMMLHILGAIFASLLGFNLIVREIRERSSDIVYTLPVSRTSFFINKALAVIVQIVVFVVVITIFTVISLLMIEKIALGRFILYMFIYTLMLIIIAFLSFSLGAILKSGAKNMTALIIPLPLYILSLISSLTDNIWLKRLKYLTPFTFADPITFLKGGNSFETISFIIFVIFTLILSLYGLYRFNQKDFTN